MQGFMWDIAPSYGAMLVFVEHRYYGQSLPFGDDSFKDLDHLQFLTSTQALADFATFITTFQEELVVRLYPSVMTRLFTLCMSLFKYSLLMS